DPNVVVVNKAAGSSGFVRDDFFDWNAAIRESISADEFELAIMIVGINDRQYIPTPNGNAPPLSDDYRAEYLRRIVEAMTQFRIANRPLIWVGLPPMRAGEYSSALAQISSLQRSAAFTSGVEFVDIYERFVDEDGNYTPYGPDLNGQQVVMRLDDGIHWTDDGSDRAAFFVDKAVRLFYRGGTVTIEVADPLAGSDVQSMLRPPYQGLGQIRLLEVAGLIVSLNEPRRALDGLVRANPPAAGAGIDLSAMVNAPVGRADSFGVGVDPLATPSLSPEPLAN
ncbi:MAG: GDSL-type esterase/lipase family protein, partial [Cucumibacter sp.]